MKLISGGLIGFLLLAPCIVLAGEKSSDQAGIVGAEISTISKHLALYPNTAIDFSKVSGEYCFDTGLGGGGHMTHYAIDPTKTKEDVIDFVNAKSLIDAGVVDVASLPKFPGSLGSMKSNQWYYLAANDLEPHHGKKFPFPLLLKAR
jgi:hypothetical protein